MITHKSRAIVLNLNMATSAFAAMTAPPLSTWFLSKSTWLPFQVAFGLYAAIVLVLCVVPETLEAKKPALGDVADDNLSRELPHQAPVTSHNGTFLSANVLLCFLQFFLKRTGFTSENFVYQYASRELGWPLRRTAVLQLAKWMGAFLVLAAVLPSLSYYLLTIRRRKPGPINVYTVRISCVVLIIGHAMLWLGTTPLALIRGILMCGLGEGLEPALQAVTSSLVSKALTGRVFTAIAASEMVAQMIAGPLMSELLSLGFNMDPLWHGLVYLVASVSVLRD